jgi:hypothetical protein
LRIPGLGGSYVSEKSPPVLVALVKESPVAARVSDDAQLTSVEKTMMVKGEQITTQVQQHWGGEADLTARHDELTAEPKAIHNEYLNAQDTCAAAMATVSGAETRRSVHIEHASSWRWD